MKADVNAVDPPRKISYFINNVLFTTTNMNKTDENAINQVIKTSV